MLRRLGAVAVITLLTMAQAVTAAADDDASCKHKGYDGLCFVKHHDPRSPAPGGDSGSGKSPGGGHGEPASCVDHLYRHPAAAVPCSSADGTWSNAGQCYARPMVPQPQASDPVWPSDKSLTGVVYECRAPAYAGGANVRVYWAAAPPGVPAPPDPLVLAREAVAAMRLAPVDIGLAPKPSPGAAALIGLPIWMWVDHPRANTWGPITRSASDGGLTVTATASVDQVKWTMGDGSTISCGVGTPRPAGGGSAPSPNCGYSYSKSSATESGHVYAISATSHWTVRWSAGAVTGTIPLDLTANAELAVVESHPVLTAP